MVKLEFNKADIEEYKDKIKIHQKMVDFSNKQISRYQDRINKIKRRAERKK